MFSVIIFILIAALGFIMSYLYRQTTTSAHFFKPDPRNAMKLFLVVFVTATLLILALSHLATYELTASNLAAENSEKYQNVKSVMIFMINLFFFLLVMLCDAYSLALKKLAIIPYLLTIGFYVLFTVKDAYFISDYYVFWQKSLELLKGQDLPDFHKTGWVKSLLGTAVTLFNAIVIWWGLRKP
jgi:predicted signal transduction protein with EAL and GGDEF domain